MIRKMWLCGSLKDHYETGDNRWKNIAEDRKEGKKWRPNLSHKKRIVVSKSHIVSGLCLIYYIRVNMDNCQRFSYLSASKQVMTMTFIRVIVIINVFLSNNLKSIIFA